MSAPAEEPATCAGREGVGGCRFAPVVYIAGDAACAYHVTSLTKLRLAETHGHVTVETIPTGPWATDTRPSDSNL